MKTLVILPLFLGAASFKTMPSIEFLKNFENPEPILVKPKIRHEPMVWIKMVEGVKRFEGYYATPYICNGGVITTGYGHTGKYAKSKYISKQKAHEILLKDLKKAENNVKKYVKVPLTHGQYACLVSFTFNCGEGNLKNLVSGKDRLNSGNYKSVERLLPLYRRANGKILKGLIKRRAWELELWNDDSNTYYVKN